MLCFGQAGTRTKSFEESGHISDKYPSENMMCGGTGSVKEADDHVKELCSTLKGAAETKAGKQFDEFSAISYKSQVVAGTNYFVKVHTGSEVFVHIRIFSPLPGQGEPEVHSLQHDKSRDEDIAYF